jgi:hypothetical protein
MYMARSSKGSALRQVTLPEGHQTESLTGHHEDPRVRHRLGNPQPFFPEDLAFRKRAQLGVAPGEPAAGVH